RDVTFWTTFNEPEIYVLNSWYRGIWPPQRKNLWLAISAMRTLRRAHQRAYHALKTGSVNREISVAVNQSYFESAGGFINDAVTKSADWLWNGWFLRHVHNEMDFIGCNYYFHNRINYGFNKNENKRVNDMGWEIYPEGMYHVLLNLKKYNKPIYITENGIADARDTLRADFIKESLRYTLNAIRSGVDVCGYFHWSLLDNFEWDKGFWPRFGLVEVDYQTMERRIRKSAKLFLLKPERKRLEKSGPPPWRGENRGLF
ncbi:MAG: family 1 glycosylhydrolase, partial [Patescibacteria group bacterium]